MFKKMFCFFRKEYFVQRMEVNGQNISFSKCLTIFKTKRSAILTGHGHDISAVYAGHGHDMSVILTGHGQDMSVALQGW